MKTQVLEQGLQSLSTYDRACEALEAGRRRAAAGLATDSMQMLKRFVVE